MKKLSLKKLFVSCTQEEYNNMPHHDEETLYFVSGKKNHDDSADALRYSVPLVKENKEKPEES